MHYTEPHTHYWNAATCTEPRTCDCGETLGAALGHKFVNGVCTRCQAADPDYVAPPVGGEDDGEQGGDDNQGTEPAPELNFFQKGSFEDGYQRWDVSKAILGTVGDAGMGIVKGVGKLGEGIGDLVSYGIIGAADLLGADDKWVADAKKRTQENLVDKMAKPADDYLNEYSVLGRTSDAVMQGIGQVGGILATGGLGAAAGLGTAGTTALTTAVTGLSGVGSGMGEAYQGGATDKEALTYGLISGTADALSELIFGGLGKAVKATGLSVGLSSADDILAQKLSKKVSSTLAKNVIELGVKSGAEGLEEVLAGTAQAVGKKLTYMSESDIMEIIEDENLLEQFVVGALTSGIAQSPSVLNATTQGRDYISGLTNNEQAVIDKVYEDTIAEKEKNGKLTNKEKNKIYDAVVKDMERGYIDTDTIESVLGGESYKGYQSMVEQETALNDQSKSLTDEINTLLDKENPTMRDSERLAEARKELEQVKSNLESLDIKTAKSNLFSEVDKLTANDTKLRESYNEKARRGQAFEADLTKYNAKQQETIKKAVESGILNNTNRTHEFVDLVAKISADTGVHFDFTNNQKLKESGFAIDGKQVNGFVTKDGVTLNVQSAKSLDTVVGHEITHVLEGTELYTELQTAVVEYAKSKNDYQGRYDSLTKLYENIEGANIDSELTAELVGDYIFTDTYFIHNLSTNHRNVFQKIYDEVKYLYKLATAGSKEARELEKVKKAFEDAYRANVKGKTDTKTQHSLSELTFEYIDKMTDEELDKYFNEIGLGGFLELDIDDSILLDEDFSVEDISEETEVEPEVIKILYRRKGLGDSHVEDNHKAVMTQDRIDQRIAEHGASNPDYARRYITRISPKDFIDMTVYERNMNRENFDTRVRGDFDGKMGDWDYEKQLSESEEPPVLIIDKSTGQIIGHNGRHRMRALEMAGVDSVEIEVEFHDEDGYMIKYNSQTIPDMAISSQFDTAIETHISNIIPLNNAHRGEIGKHYGESAHSNAAVKYSINEKFYDQVNKWDGKTTGFSFVVGETSQALQEAGLPQKQIRWDASKIKTLLDKHDGMTIDTVKQIPGLLENPVIVVDSKKGNNSKIVMGDVYDENGKIVTAVLLLTPSSKKGNVLDFFKVSSAEGRSHIKSLFTKEDGTAVPIRYVDKKRIQSWLNANRLQLPLHNLDLDSNYSISHFFPFCN